MEHPEFNTPSYMMEPLVSEIQHRSCTVHEIHSAVHQFLPIMGLVRAATFTLACFGMAHGFTLNMATSPRDGAMSRREAVSSIAASTTFAGVALETCSCVVRNQQLRCIDASLISGSLVSMLQFEWSSRPVAASAHTSSPSKPKARMLRLLLVPKTVFNSRPKRDM